MKSLAALCFSLLPLALPAPSPAPSRPADLFFDALSAGSNTTTGTRTAVKMP